jgi:hypothetical protein
MLVLLLGLFTYLGFGDAYNHIKIFYTAPDAPVGEQKHPVDVMHGSVKYVTQSELQKVRDDRDRANLVGIPFVVAFVLLATSGNTQPFRRPAG